MPHLVSEAFDYNDVIWQTRALVLNFPLPSVSDSQDPTVVPEVIDNDIGGGSVGQGRVYIAALSSRVVLEEITLICTTGGGDGTAIFTVVGGTTGAFTTTTLTAGQRYVSNDLLIIIRTTNNWSATGDPDRIRFTLVDGDFLLNVQETELCTFTASTDLIERDDNENWTDHGYSVGGGIFVAGAVQGGNNGFHLIEALATDQMTIDDVLSTIADETSISVTIQPYNVRVQTVGITVDFTATGDEVFLQGDGDGWNALHVQEGDYVLLGNAATSGHNDFWKVLRVFTSGGGTNRDTMQLESGAITANDTDDIIDITVFFIPERWVEDRFREGANEVSMTAPPTEDGNGDFQTTWEFHAPGISGTEAVYGSCQARFSQASSFFNIGWRMAQGFLRSNGHGSHPGSSTFDVYQLLNRAEMQFYMSVNGDAMWGFSIATGTVGEPVYVGFIRRHGTTLQLPYPAIVAACAGLDTVGVDLPSNDVTSVHSAFINANMDTVGGGGPNFNTSRAWFLRKDGIWGNIVHGTGTSLGGRDNGASMDGTPMFDGWFTPYHVDGENEETGTQIDVGGMGVAQRKMNTGFGDTFERIPIEMHDSSNVYGELHGMTAVTNQGDSAQAMEDFMDDGGVRHILCQNSFRTNRNNFLAVRLEP